MTFYTKRLTLNHMVEYNPYLDGLFGSLADPIRRDILQKLVHAQRTISQLAENYEMSFAAVAKHLSVLEKAKLIVKRRNGREQIVSIAPDALRDASEYLDQFEALWNYRFDTLDALLQEDDQNE
ncbi:helix-turn-helix transcriptional regulator [Alicyclobacillus sp. SO9]|uniref:ArsR/SmtB family transcription factor n=1 Tax=Alicyclobacillus sp. SO9 TaxID=2665646 RepID=UPI0018E82928|nr:metalloregulator ArsR/SmtB family transcription factor [Alicyclobacillus sp. SO9]